METRASFSLYESAHLFVAAVRVLTHKDQSPPDIDQVCAMLNLSPERGGFICRRLEEIGALETVAGAYGLRLFVRDHLRIEDIPQEEAPDRLQNELHKFQAAQKDVHRRFESMRADQKQKQKNRFAEMEKKLRAEIEKKKS
ncbi:MAG: hypothetical protein PVJ53_08495 [Desulfobacterales bacterium]